VRQPTEGPGGLAIWLDPGATTGVAAWDFDRRLFRSWQEDFLRTGQLIGNLAELQGPESPIRLGYEQYNILPGSFARHDGSALMVIGMARWLCLLNNIGMLPSQPNSARRLGLRHLKTLGWHVPGRGHANDAAGHLATWMITGDLLPGELKERLRGDSGD
jgi:hypothetical protein